MSWHIQLLGALSVKKGDALVTRFRTQKTGGLLAYLAYFNQTAHSRETVIEVLWPGVDPASGRNRLNVALSSLRSQLEPMITDGLTPVDGVSSGESVPLLITDYHTVRLHPGLRTDAGLFEKHLEQARRARQRSEEIAALRSAVACYGGTLLPGYYEDWIVTEQERLRERYLDAVRELVAYYEGIGQSTLAAEIARDARQKVPDAEQIAAPQAPKSPANTAPQTPPAPVATEVPAAPILAPDAGPVVQTLALALVEFSSATTSTTDAQAQQRRVLAAIGANQPSPLAHGNAQVLSDSLLLVGFAQAAELLRAVRELNDVERFGDGAFRVALDVGEVTWEHGGWHGDAIRRLLRLIAMTGPGDRAILCSESAAALLRRHIAPPVTLSRAGKVALASGAEAETLSTLRLTDRFERETPASGAPAMEAMTGTLPRAWTDFFGRQGESDYLMATLRPGYSGLITLTGPGGIGKTRLVTEVGRRLAPLWSGRVCFVPLADLKDYRDVPLRLVERLSLSTSGGRDPLEVVIEELNEAPTLLILDNLEQLLSDGAAEIIASLLARAPSLACLATSRVHVNLSMEQILPIVPLSTPQSTMADWSVDKLERYPALQLFTARARAVRPDFRITESNAAVVSELCRFLEGVPLALELAAARVSAMAPSQILTQVRDHVGDLQSRKRDLPERHRSLRLAMNWSYELLPPELQQRFQQLSVFRGGWTLTAAAEVCGIDRSDEIADDLTTLLECSLIVRSATGGQTEGDTEDAEAEELPEPRFQMLEMLRQFGADCLREADEAATTGTAQWEATRDRHRAYFLHVAEEAAPSLQGGASVQAQWLERLHADLDNFRAALADPTEDALRLACALHRFWLIRGYLDEGRRYLAALLAAHEASAPAALIARAYNASGILAWSAGDLTTAESFFQRALDSERRSNNPAAVAKCLNNLGIVANQKGDLEAAREFCEESLAIYRQVEDRAAIGMVLNNLGVILSHLDRLDEAHARVEESLSLQKGGDPLGISTMQHNLAMITSRRGDQIAAAQLLLESMMVRREREHRTTYADMLYLVAAIATRAGAYEQAARLFGASEAAAATLKTPLAPVAGEQYDGLQARCRAQFQASADFAALHRAGLRLGVSDALDIGDQLLRSLIADTGTASVPANPDP